MFLLSDAVAPNSMDIHTSITQDNPIKLEHCVDRNMIQRIVITRIIQRNTVVYIDEKGQKRNYNHSTKSSSLEEHQKKNSQKV